MGVDNGWRSRYVVGVAITDFILLLGSTLAAWALRFESGVSAGNAYVDGAGHVSHVVVSIVLAIVWWMVLFWIHSHDLIVVGRGADEFRGILRATAFMIAILGAVSLTFAVSLSRAYLILVFAFGVPALIVGRSLWRAYLRRQRRKGSAYSRVLVIGTLRSARRVARSFIGDESAGYRVTGVLTPDADEDEESLLWRTADDLWPPIQVLGNSHEITEALAVAEADTVIVTDSEQLGPDGLNALTWALDVAGVELLVSPNVAGVAQARIRVRDISNVPYVHLQTPLYKGAMGLPKALLDRSLSVLGLVVMLPVMAVVALAVRLSGPGPVLERSRRVGVNGHEFSLLEFRTLRADHPSRDRTSALSADDDPGLTRVGGFLRRSGLDDLPQLFNLLVADISLVGPRPLSPAELAALPAEHAQHRMLVRPGLVGTWRGTDPTSFTAADAARLDLEYVENWSLSSDLAILALVARRLVSRFYILRAVNRLQARLLAGSPGTKVRLTVDAHGRVMLNEYVLFSGDMAQLLEELESLIVAERPALVVTSNVDQILDLERERRTVDVYDAADIIVMDGMPVVQLARMMGADSVHRHTGADLLPLLADESAARKWRIAVMGGADGVSDQAVETLRAARPGAEIHAVDFPVLTSMDDPASLDVIECLRAVDPDVVFVCLGAPKQELWYLQWRDQLPPAVYIGAGAAVDFAAQKVRRAPVLMQKIGAEWTWRLAQEPRRLAGRYLAKGPAFLLVIGRSLMRRGKKAGDDRG